VDQLGSVAATRLRIGQHVVLSFGYCDSCRFCATARPAICSRIGQYNFSGKRADGSAPISSLDGAPIGGQFFAQSSWSHIALAHMSCVVPVDLSAQELHWAGAFSCGVMTGAGTVCAYASLDRFYD
jgi:aryl-alcohol dehydrogenase